MISDTLGGINEKLYCSVKKSRKDYIRRYKQPLIRSEAKRSLMILKERTK